MADTSKVQILNKEIVERMSRIVFFTLSGQNPHLRELSGIQPSWEKVLAQCLQWEAEQTDQGLPNLVDQKLLDTAAEHLEKGLFTPEQVDRHNRKKLHQMLCELVKKGRKLSDEEQQTYEEGLELFGEDCDD